MTTIRTLSVNLQSESNKNNAGVLVPSLIPLYVCIYTVEPSVSNHPKFQTQMVAYERWWLMRDQSSMSQNFASIAYSNCTDLNKLFKQKVNFEKKNNVLSNEKFLSLVLLTGSISITIQHQSCIIQFMLHDLETFSILEDWSLRRSG